MKRLRLVGVTIAGLACLFYGVLPMVQSPKVVIAPMGYVTDAQMGFVADTLASYFGVSVEVMKRPLYAKTYHPHDALDADALMAAIEHKEIDGSRFIIITDQPLVRYEENNVLHLLGYAQVDGRNAVVSIHNMRQEGVFAKRLSLVALHELGHTLGLEHCESSQPCFMKTVRSVYEVDTLTPDLCKHCKLKLSLRFWKYW